MGLRWALEFDGLAFFLREGRWCILDDLGCDRSHGQVGDSDSGVLFSSQRLGDGFFHFSDEDPSQPEVDFMGREPGESLLLFFFWPVCVDGGRVLSIGRKDFTGKSEPFDPLRGFDFLALLCLRLILLVCRDFVLIILEIYHNETTTQSLLIRKGSHNGGGVGSRDPSAWVPLSDEEFPVDVLTDDSRDFLEDFCS
jgi:hypothetical protein